MGEVVAVLEQQRSVSTTKPSPAEERGRKGGGATRPMSKRNWQASNTINFDILHHRQKRSEGFQMFSECCHHNTFSPPPISPSSLSRTCSKAGQELVRHRSLQNQALAAGKSPGYQKQTLPASAEFTFPLRERSGICAAPPDYRHPSYFSTNNFEDQQLYSFLHCKKPERQIVPGATPVTIATEANKLWQHGKEQDLTLCTCKPDYFGFLPQLGQTDSSE